MLSAPSTAPGF